jgi:hypothetical protein
VISEVQPKSKSSKRPDQQNLQLELPPRMNSPNLILQANSMQSIGELLKAFNQDGLPENHVTQDDAVTTKKSQIFSARTLNNGVGGPPHPLPTSTVSQFSYAPPSKDIKVLTLKPAATSDREFSSPPLTFVDSRDF